MRKEDANAPECDPRPRPGGGARPGRLRLTLDVGTGADRSRVVLVAAGDKGWQSTGGMVAELGPERLAELREEAYVVWLTTLTPLRQEGFELTSLPEARVGGR